jgi:hypothetical protein
LEEYEGFVYVWYHRKTGCYYVGIHKGTTDDGYIGSGVGFNEMWNSTYPEEWNRTVLFTGNYVECAKRERLIVNDDRLKDPLCLNRTLGGAINKNGSNGRKSSANKLPWNKNLHGLHKDLRPIKLKHQKIKVKDKIYNQRIDAIKDLNISFSELDKMDIELIFD